jgi:hypothetical protein
LEGRVSRPAKAERFRNGVHAPAANLQRSQRDLFCDQHTDDRVRHASTDKVTGRLGNPARDALMQWLRFSATGAVFRRLSFSTRFWLSCALCEATATVVIYGRSSDAE